MQLNQGLQGGVQLPTGGIAHEPQGRIRCNSEADRTVGMKEDRIAQAFGLRPCACALNVMVTFRAFVFWAQNSVPPLHDVLNDPVQDIFLLGGER